MACRRAMAVAVLAGLLGLLGGRPGRAAPPAVPVEDTKLYLERDTKAQEQLAKARQAAAAGQWREASEAYQRVADFVGRDGTQPVVPSRDEPSVLIPIQEAASVDLARALAGRPLELYREAHDGPAHKLLERALPARDVALLRAVVRRYLATSSGDEALSALGSIAFERGDYVGALTAWRRLLALCREPSVSPPDVKVRQWACLRALGRTHEAAALAGDLAAHHADATVRFGGREVGVAGVLARPFAPARPGPVNEWPELGGCPSRAREPLGLEEVGEPVWRFRVPNAAVGSSARRAFEERGLRVPLALHAQAADGRVVVSNEAAVYALDAATGGLVWMYPDAPGPPQAAAREDATHAVACAAGRATVRFADSVAAFDLKSGRRLWHHAFVKPEAEPEKPKAEENRPDAEDKDAEPPAPKLIHLAAPPVAAGRHVLIALTEFRDEARASVLALDAATGRKVWKTFVCSRTISPFLGLGAVPSPPAVSGSTLYFSTNLGAVAALDVATGTVLWIQKYDSFHTHLRKAFLERRRRWANNPVVVEGGRVFVAPQDSARLLAIEAASGSVAWSAPRQGARYLVWGRGPRLYLAGSALAALDKATGKRLWAVGLPEEAAGQPQVCRDKLYVPTAKALMTASTQDGSLATCRIWHQGEQSGNVAFALGKLLVASNDRVMAFGDWAQAMKRLQARRKAAPEDPEPLLALGTHAAHRGSHAAAIGRFERALALATRRADARARRRARTGLHRAYRALGERGDLEALSKALAFSPGPDAAAETLLAVARIHEQAKHWPAAIEALQAILERYAEARVRLEKALTVSARAVATAGISRLIRQCGRAAYAAQEARAAERLAAAKKPTDFEAVVRGFPNSEAAEKALRARLFQPDAKTLAPDLAALAQLLPREPAHPEARARIAARLKALRQSARGPGPPLQRHWQVHTRVAHSRAEMLEMPGLPDDLVLFYTTRRTFAETSHGLECRRLATGQLVWQREVGDWSRLSVAGGGQAVLAIFDELLALDLASGARRWRAALGQEPGAPAIRLAPPALRPPRRWRVEKLRAVALARGPDTIYAALAGGTVVALAAEDGKVLWRRDLGARSLVEGALFLEGGKLWTCAEQPAMVFALDPKTGQLASTIGLPGPDPRITERPVYDAAHGRLFVILAGRFVHTLDLRAGRVLWGQRMDFGISKLLVTADGTHCYILPNRFVVNGQVLSLDPASGEVRRRRSVRLGALTNAAIGPDALYLAERDNLRNLVIQALDPDSLAERWRSVPLRLYPAMGLTAGRGFVAATGLQDEDTVAVVLDARNGKTAADLRPEGVGSLSVGRRGGLLCLAADRGIFAYGPAQKSLLEQRIAALTARVAAGHKPSLGPLANALYRLGREDRAIPLLERALADETLPDGQYFALKDQLDSLRESLAARHPAVMTTPQLAVPPKIDGMVDEPWRAECAAVLGGPAFIHEIQGHPQGEGRWRSRSDLSAVLYTAWDERRFYFAIDVTDDLQRTHTSRSPTWVGDGLIICVDGDNDGGYHYKGSDLLLTLALIRKDERREDRDKDSTPKGEYRVRRKADNSGTVYEVAIPWRYMGIAKPSPGLRFGFNITVTDDDGDHAAKAISWTPGMILDRRRTILSRGFIPAYFGDIHLTGPPPGAAPAPAPPPRRDRPVEPRRER